MSGQGSEWSHAKRSGKPNVSIDFLRSHCFVLSLVLEALRDEGTLSLQRALIVRIGGDLQLKAENWWQFLYAETLGSGLWKQIMSKSKSEI